MKRIRIVQIRNGKRHHVEISPARARELGLSRSTSTPVTVAYLMEGAFAWDGTVPGQAETCSRCGTTLREVVLYHRVGCSDCYSVFARSVDRIIGHRNEAESYSGRIPKRLERFKRLFVDREALRSQIASALSEEDFESAARYRDKLEQLESDAND